MRCACCPWELYRDAGKQKLPNRTMTFDVFKQIMQNTPTRVNIEFSGFTEPSFNPELVNMVLYAKAKGHSVQVFTTLTGITDEGMAKLATIRFNKFVVHVPDDTNMLWDTDKYLDILRRFHKHKIKGVVYGALGKVDERIVAELSGKHLFATYVFNKNGIKGEDGGVENTGKLRCSFNYQGLNLDQNCVVPNGDVCICPQDFGIDNVVGNLTAQSYDEIINGEPLKDFRRRMLTERSDVLCRNCEYAKPLHSGQKDARNVHVWRKAHELNVLK